MKRFSIIFIFLIFCAVSKATHNRAGQILYRHISGHTYEFTVTTFTWSRAAADRSDIDISWGDNTVSRGVPRIPRERNLVEILPGEFQRNIYIARHTFPGPGVYTIVVEDPNRNLGVENIPNSVSVVFSVKTTLRIDPNTGHNNSPVFLNYPIDKAAVGRLFIHNPAAYDVDGDSLSYSLAVCTRERGIEIETYTFPEASNEMYIDPITGDLVWDTPIKTGIYNIAIQVDEWRNGIKIGSILRDIQIEVVETDNQPPELPAFRDTCVVAGTLLEIPVFATDPDDDEIVLTASGGPFEVITNKAEFTVDDSGAGYTNATFTWQTDLSHVRNQRYSVVFKAEDQNEIKLVTFANFNITVIAPKVENLEAIAEKREIFLQWDQSICDHASGYEIYRSIGEVDLELDDCETSIPSGRGYERIAVLNGIDNTFYRDNNNGMGLSPGIEYCYRVVAIFADGGKSLPSDQACASLLAGTPPIIRAHVETVDNISGEIHVVWLEKPNQEKVAGRPGPFEYRLFHSTDMYNWNLLRTSIYGIRDTVFVHRTINTKTIFPHYYKVELWDRGENVIVDEDFEIASSLYPMLEPSDKSIVITFGRYAPWVNYEYDIFRCTKTGDDICIPTEANFAGRTNRETYTDTGLKNGQEYCYIIRSRGYRYIDGIRYDNENWSHVVCQTPEDNVPPCPPELFAESICDENRNQLEWIYDPACMDDMEKFRIYFSPDPLKYAYAKIDSIFRDINWLERDLYSFSHNRTLIGCYYVTAVDSAQNESIWSNIICLDECGGAGGDGGYEIPNVFTPNDDGLNDVLIAHNPAEIVTKVDMKIYTRAGKLVYRTEDPYINWDGKDIDSKQFVPTGIYFYICDVYEQRLEGERIVTISGFIHVYRESTSGSTVY